MSNPRGHGLAAFAHPTARFTTPDAPKALVEAHNGAFRHLTQLRGAAMSELLLLREVFNLIVGGSGGRG